MITYNVTVACSVAKHKNEQLTLQDALNQCDAEEGEAGCLDWAWDGVAFTAMGYEQSYRIKPIY